MATQLKNHKYNSEFFRFVALRAPQLPKRSINTKLYISYPTELLKSEASLYQNYLKTTSKSDDNTSWKKGKVLLEEFKKSNNFYSKSEQLDKDFPKVLDFFEWLENTKTDEVSYVKKHISKHLNDKEINALAKNTKLINKLWDNFCVHIIEQANAEVIQGITNVLRVFNIINEIDSNKSIDINNLEKARVVVPENLFPTPIFTGTSLPEDDNIVNDLKEQLIHLNELKALKEKLEIISEEKLNSLAGITYNIDDKIPPSSQNLAITTTDLKALSKQEQSHLTKLKKGRSSYNADQAISWINDELNGLYIELSSAIKTSTKVGVFGNKIIAFKEEKFGNQDQTLSKTSKPVSWKDDCSFGDAQNPFNVIYPCLFRKNPAAQLNISIGEFKRVESEISCYKAGEIAHIENILRGESKEVDTRKLTRTEENFSYEKETIEEEERDVQSTDRYEMERETQNIIDNETSLETGVSVSANYGGIVQVDANVGFSTSISTQNSTKNSIEYAQSVTDKARKRVYKRVLESRSTKNIREFEVKNNHKLQGSPDENTSGVYRWVNKTQDVRLMNYGKRMMIQFNIPEPASYHIHNVKNQDSQTSDLIIDKPVDPAKNETLTNIAQYTGLVTPLKPLSSMMNLDENNYHVWAAAYNADVPVPPAYKKMIGKSYHKSPEEPKDIEPTYSAYSGSNQDISIPQGYKASYVLLEGNKIQGDPYYHNELRVNVGNRYLRLGAPQNIISNTLNFFVDTLPVSWEAHRVDLADFNLNITCIRSAELYNEWRKQAYQAIMDAYQDKVAEYNQFIQEAKAQAGIQIKGKNPRRNKEIIVQELKRNCIDFIRVYSNPIFPAGHYISNIHGAIPAMGVNNNADKIPVVQNPIEALINGKYADFMEGVMEWDQMTWDFHSYFWAHPDRWSELYSLEDNDPLFTNFLQSGSASVIVPVKPGLEKHLMYYIRTGRLWMGGDAPIIDTLLDQYIDQELVNQDPLAAPSLEANWEETVPTNLVILQEDANGVSGDLFCK